MLNLLRFRPDGGEAGYRAYAEAFTPFAQRYGAEVVYVGSGRRRWWPRRAGWDAVLLVRYPSRQAFSDMVRDPEYQQVTHLRTESLPEAVLQATTPW